MAAVSRKRWRCHSASLRPALFATFLQRSWRKLGLHTRPPFCGDGKTTGQFSRVLLENPDDFLRERDGALLPVFGEEAVFGFGRHMHAAPREIQVRPVERLQFAAAEAGGKRFAFEGFILPT